MVWCCLGDKTIKLIDLLSQLSDKLLDYNTKVTRYSDKLGSRFQFLRRLTISCIGWWMTCPTTTGDWDDIFSFNDPHTITSSDFLVSSRQFYPDINIRWLQTFFQNWRLHIHSYIYTGCFQQNGLRKEAIWSLLCSLCSNHQILSFPCF